MVTLMPIVQNGNLFRKRSFFDSDAVGPVSKHEHFLFELVRGVKSYLER